MRSDNDEGHLIKENEINLKKKQKNEIQGRCWDEKKKFFLLSK
jgi:hypothetical protein